METYLYRMNTITYCYWPQMEHEFWLVGFRLPQVYETLCVCVRHWKEERKNSFRAHNVRIQYQSFGVDKSLPNNNTRQTTIWSVVYGICTHIAHEGIESFAYFIM